MPSRITATSQPPAINTSDALRVAFLGEEAEYYEAVSSCADEGTIPLVTQGFIDLLTSESHRAPGGGITRETLEKRIPATERRTLSSLSLVYQEIATAREKADGHLSKKQLADLRGSMPRLREKLNNIREYTRGKHAKAKRDEVERAYAQLAKCLAMYEEAGSTDNEEVSSDVETVPKLYNTGNSRL
jgi:hypothetical protein